MRERLRSWQSTVVCLLTVVVGSGLALAPAAVGAPVPAAVPRAAVAVTTTALGAGQQGVPYVADLKASGGTGYRWAITGGALPVGLSLNANGAIRGTPTTIATSTFTVRVTAGGGATASRQLSIKVTATADWLQQQRTADGRGWNPNEDVVNPSNISRLGQSWALEAQVEPVVAGGRIYSAGQVPGRPGTYAPMALNLRSGDLESYGPSLPQPNCQHPPVAIAGTRLLAGCGSLIAYQLAAPHQRLWSTADTDPGTTTSQFVVAGSTVVAWSQDRVLAYRLSDGQRLWQQLVPAGTGSIYDVAVEGTTVVVKYQDRLRAFALATGAPKWLRTGIVGGSVVAANGWAYVQRNDGVARYALSNGAPGWAVLAGTDVYEIVGADSAYVYVWQATFNFGPPSPSVLLAVRQANGTVAWRYNVPSRIRSFGVTQRMVWLTSTEIYSQGRSSDLIALARSNGQQLRKIHFNDNTYGSAAFGNGRVVLPQGGSAGGSEPWRLRVFSVETPRPTITSRMVPTARRGSPFAATLRASSGTGALRWSVSSGQLPPGVQLSPAGALSGTPAAAGLYRVNVRVVDTVGRFQVRPLSIEVLGATANTWLAAGRDGSRTGRNPGETTIRLGAAAQLGFRWKTSNPADESWVDDKLQPAVAGNVVYDVDKLGRLKAWSTTGTTANRNALWTNTALGAGNHYRESPVLSGGVLYLLDYAGFLTAVRASDGVRLWRRDLSLTISRYTADLLVVGNKILRLDRNFAVRAYNTADGSNAWGGAAVPLGGNELDGSPDLATDGVRAFALTQCRVSAVNLSNGTVAWTVPVQPGDGPGNCAGVAHRTIPIYADGAVFAATYGGAVAVNAASGVVRWRSGTRAGYADGAGVVGNGVWVLSNGSWDGGNLVALDLKTGEMLWENASAPGDLGLSIAGDLLVGRSTYSLKGFSLVTGQEVWDGGTPESSARQRGAPTIAAGKIFINTFDGIKAYGLP